MKRRIRISKVGRKYVYCFFGSDNGVFWFGIKLLKENFPKIPLKRDQIFVWKQNGAIGKQVKTINNIP